MKIYKVNPNRIGHYSGSERLEDSTLEEPDDDTDEVAQYWHNNSEAKIKLSYEMGDKLKIWNDDIIKRYQKSEMSFHMVGQSHIDIAWLWRIEQTRKKSIVTFKKAVYHIQRFPKSYCFALSEPILLEWILEDDPELFKNIQLSVEEGGIELVGGSYVEPDCMMPCGEAVTRSRLYGQRFFFKHFNRLPKVEWFLDSFGYSAGLPQILKKSGAEYLWTTKLSWNLETVFPFSNFFWEGVDQSRIQTGIFPMSYDPLTTWNKFEVGHHPLKPNVTYNGNYERDYSDLDQWVESEEIIPHVGLFFGLSDGGHGPTYEEVARANVLIELTKKFHWSRVETFFQKVEEWKDRFPIWADELYLENHRGCFSVHAEVKKKNREFENKLLAIESLSSLYSILNDTKNQNDINILEKAWKIVLKNQFHDILPGTSIPEVYDDVFEDWQTCDQMLQLIKDSISMNLKGPSIKCQFVIWNPLSWERKARVFIPLNSYNENIELDEEGRPPSANLTYFNPAKITIFAQPVSAEPEDWLDARPAGWWTIMELSATSLTPAYLSLNLEMKFENPMQSDQFFLDNGIVRIRLDSTTGGILSLTNVSILDNSNLLKGSKNNLTLAYEDISEIWPAWNLTPEYWNHLLDISNSQDLQISLCENGPIFATIEVQRTLGKLKNSVIQRYTLFKERTEIYLDYIANWQQPLVMLKVGLNTATNATRCTTDVMFGAIEHSTVPKTPADKARFEKICQKFYDLSTPTNEWGIATLNQDKYAFSVNNGESALTMLRSPPYFPASPEAWVHEERAIRKEKYGSEVPEYSGLGPFRSQYAYLSHEGGGLITQDNKPNSLVRRAAEEYNQPVHVLKIPQGKQDYKLEVEGQSIIQIESDIAMLSTIKMNEWDSNGNLIIRIVEILGVGGSVCIALNSIFQNKIVSAREVDLLERPISGTTLKIEKTGIKISLTPFEAKSIELVLK
ncbi:MAG: alpha-mannosidase [Candidatus Hodarchaeales archaeon]|jgi:alpha-mannosidase